MIFILLKKIKIFCFVCFKSKALQRLRCTTNVEDDIEEMRIEDRAQQQEAKV